MCSLQANAVNATNVKYNYELYQANSAQQTNNVAASDTTVTTDSYQTTQTTAATADGKDDGKIGFWGATKSFFKGIWNTTVGAVVNIGKGLVSGDPKQVLQSVGQIALIGVGVLATVGLNAVVPGLGVAVGAAIGGVMGAITVTKGAVQAANATTDAEAEAAWENIGAGSFQVAMACVGAKAAKTTMQANNAATGATAMKPIKGQGFKQGFKNAGSNIKNTCKNGYAASKAEGGTLNTMGKVKNTFADSIKDNGKLKGLYKGSTESIKQYTRVGQKYTQLGEGRTTQRTFGDKLKDFGEASLEVAKENRIVKKVHRQEEKMKKIDKKIERLDGSTEQVKLEKLNKKYTKLEEKQGKWKTKATKAQQDADFAEAVRDQYQGKSGSTKPVDADVDSSAKPVDADVDGSAKPVDADGNTTTKTEAKVDADGNTTTKADGDAKRAEYQRDSADLLDKIADAKVSGDRKAIAQYTKELETLRTKNQQYFTLEDTTTAEYVAYKFGSTTAQRHATNAGLAAPAVAGTYIDQTTETIATNEAEYADQTTSTTGSAQGTESTFVLQEYDMGNYWDVAERNGATLRYI